MNDCMNEERKGKWTDKFTYMKITRNRKREITKQRDSM